MLMRFLLLLALLPAAGYWLLAWYAVRRHLRVRPEPARSFSSRVSILKPVCGADSDTYENFASFCRQDYPDFEILFGVREPDDPAAAVIDRLRRDFPQVNIGLVFAQRVGANPKVSTLRFLPGQARGEVLAISDGDIRVAPDYLRHMVAPLDDPAVGVVTCPYRGEVRDGNWVSHLAALHMNATFLPSAVLAGTMLGVRLGLGASMAVRRADLERIGGFEAIANYLAEDYQLASRIADLGLQIRVARHVVSCPLSSMPFAEQWERELRWARGIRATSGGYFGLPLTWLTPQAILLAIILAPSDRLWPVGLAGLGFAMLLRWLVAWRVGRYLRLERIGRTLVWLPLRDVVTCAAWLAGLFGRRIVWREQRFFLRSDGRLEVDTAARNKKRGNPLRRAVRWLDERLRRRDGVYEYSQHPQCVFRVSVARTTESVDLSDGAHLDAGQAFGDLHLWNEHVPQIPRSGPGIGWAIGLTHGLKRAMRELARHAPGDARLRGIEAFRAVVTFAGPERMETISRIMKMLGLELVEPKRRPSLRDRLHLLGEDILMVGLRWTFNPGSRLGATRKRYAFWISTRHVLELHGSRRDDVTEERSRIASGAGA